MRAALVLDNKIVNVIEYDSTEDYEPGEGVEIVDIDNKPVDIGWIWNGAVFSEPPIKDLSLNPVQISANNIEVSVITYRNTFGDAPAEVEFDVNGAKAAVSLVEGVAQLEVTAAQPDEILVICDGLYATITVTEV